MKFDNVWKATFRYYKFSMLITAVLAVMLIVDNIVNQVLPTIDVFYVLKFIILFFIAALILLIPIVIIDYIVVKALVIIFKDLKNSDTKGRILFVLALVLVLLRKIYIWTR